jgi:hypothetical protein
MNHELQRAPFLQKNLRILRNIKCLPSGNLLRALGIGVIDSVMEIWFIGARGITAIPSKYSVMPFFARSYRSTVNSVLIKQHLRTKASDCHVKKRQSYGWKTDAPFF